MTSSDNNKTAGRKRPNQDEEAEADCRSSKSARVNIDNVVDLTGSDDDKLGDTTANDEYLEPMQPIPNYTFQGYGVCKFVIYLAIKEKKDSPFSRGLQQCELSCPGSIHNHCFQRDGTRHVTMCDGVLTYEQARGLRFVGEEFAPVKVEIEGWTRWQAGCYLKLKPSTTKKLKSLLGQIEGLPAGKQSCDHLSLYRLRGYHNAAVAKQNFKTIRDELARHDWGSVQGVSIRIKAMGPPGYDECMVLAGV